MDCLLVVEDAPSEAVLRRLVSLPEHDLQVTSVFRAGGFGQIKGRLANFRNACHVIPHIVLTDLDTCPCPPELLKNWQVGKLPEHMLMRIAVREVESWLLADREGIAKLIGVPLVKIPACPDELADPKQVLLNLARKSKSPRFASEFVPAKNSKAQHGPFYNQHLTAFATQFWDSHQAGLASPSLKRSMDRIKAFAQGLQA